MNCPPSYRWALDRRVMVNGPNSQFWKRKINSEVDLDQWSHIQRQKTDTIFYPKLIARCSPDHVKFDYLRVSPYFALERISVIFWSGICWLLDYTLQGRWREAHSLTILIIFCTSILGYFFVKFSLFCSKRGSKNGSQKCSHRSLISVCEGY